MYEVTKVYNNNIVMVKDEEEKQMIIVHKGIGFGKKTGNKFEAGKSGEKFFYVMEDQEPTYLKQFGKDLEKLSIAITKIVELAEETLEIENDKLYDALLDHIGFSIQRLRMGLAIDNPFVEEIAVLYGKEFSFAREASEIIREIVGVDLGEAECGFIALHLRSAKKRKPISFIMKTPRVYNDIMNMVQKKYKIQAEMEHTNCRSFLLSLDWMIRLSAKGFILDNVLSYDISTKLPGYMGAAEKIADLVKSEMKVELCREHICFLAADIYRFVQFCGDAPQE